MIDLNITGLDKLERDLKEFEKAISSLDGEIGNVQFDPDDKASVDRAVRDMKTMIDRRVGRFRNNAMTRDLIKELKRGFEKEIRTRTSSARR